MTNDKTREDFEAWWRERGLGGEDVQWEAYQAATQHSAARIAELEAEVQALRKDAERYRWLRDSKIADDQQEWLCVGVFDMGGVSEIDGAELDFSIDAAIEAERGEG